jgi:uncharacterized protein YyaL (SSP411 family)
MRNRLAAETSPYLLQHADNPVDWFPWGEEAFQRSRADDKPLLLSVGYSSCHWCHVMAHESFEDLETAQMMNDLFVNVKVDREERPDVDGIYMNAVQAMTGRGGWPMTVWLTPEGKPFFAGTYYPKDDRPGMPSFRRVMAAVAEAWSERREGVSEQADHVAASIGRVLPAGETIPGRDALVRAYEQISHAFDHEHGGFGGAPKFPQQPVLEFLLRAAGAEWAPQAGSMVHHTLRRMAAGGIRDHVGGGFARYSVDGHWLIPHFEKMLYDNAQLARLYLRAWQSGGTEGSRDVAIETLEYLLRDLRHPEGGFFSAEDADSEGVEGKFYVWTDEEFRRVTGDAADLAAAYFGVDRQGNFEGANHLFEAADYARVAADHGLDEADVRATVNLARGRLFAARSRRVRPGLDDKVVTAWNGLAIRAFAEAGAALGRERYLVAAGDAARFLLERLRRDDGRLLRSWGRGRAVVPGFLDDYAAVAIGVMTLYQATGDLTWYREADHLVRRMVDLFRDEDGSWYSTGCDAQRLITRPKDQMDNPLPSGSSLAAEALLWLSLYTGEAEPRRYAEELILEAAMLVERYPSAAGHLLSILTSMEGGYREVAVVGGEADRLARVVWEQFRPHVVTAIDRDGTGGDVVPLLADRARPGETVAYVCEGFVCRVPTSDADELRAQLT